VWFFDKHWNQIRPHLDHEEQKRLDVLSIELRSNLLNSMGQYDFQLAWLPPMRVNYENHFVTPDSLVVSTIELLMLDEIAERHSYQSFVLTQEEIDDHRLLTSTFERFKQKVDDRLAEIGLEDSLARCRIRM
jgi:hypothetical protein